MKRSALAAVVASALLIASAAPGYAWVRVWVGPAWPYWYYPPPPYYVYSPPPVVVQQEPSVYVQQPVPPPPAPVRPPSQMDWYYCPSARAYYPSVSICPEPWVTVPPRSE